jgi:hypothetical protein
MLRLRMCGAISPLIHVSMVWCLIKHRKNSAKNGNVFLTVNVLIQIYQCFTPNTFGIFITVNLTKSVGYNNTNEYADDICHKPSKNMFLKTDSLVTITMQQYCNQMYIIAIAITGSRGYRPLVA